jgi:hypothetical protein
MNKLRNTVWRLGLNESQALTILQDAGIISDHCLTLQNIAGADVDRATHFLAAMHQLRDCSDLATSSARHALPALRA